MRIAFFYISLLVSYPVFANSQTVECGFGNMSIEIEAEEGDIIDVMAVNFVNGYVWTSVDDIPGNIVQPAELGGTYYTKFSIETSEQTVISKKYIFESRRPFAPKDNPWSCEIVVTVN